MASLNGGSTVGGYLILHQGMTTELLNAIKQVDGSGSGLDSDLLDGHEGTYFLDWTNTTNKPAPTITLAGDLTGSITLTNLASGTLNATVVDDSHNHIISNVDNLQDALDGKAPLAHAHGNITNAGAIGTASGLAVLTTTSGVLTTGVIPITSGGTGATDITGILTNLGVTATIDELNYVDGVTSNIQMQLNNKAVPSDIPAIATQAEVIEGINDVKYLTPKKVTGLTEKFQALGTISTNTVIDCANGNIVTATLGAAITIDIAASASTSVCRVCSLILTNGGAFTITWDSTIKWAGGKAPTLSASGVDILHFMTVNNGTTWYGCLGGKGFV